MADVLIRKVLDHGFVRLLNIAGPIRRKDQFFDASDVDPANVARMSFNQMGSERSEEQQMKLNRYLIEHNHTGPFEQIEVWLEMRLPIFVARQWIRHRTASINEVSGRYVRLAQEWYLPDPETVGFKPDNIKQGRLFAPDDMEKVALGKWFREELDKRCRESYQSYTDALDQGVPEEVARMLLHLNHYTQWSWHQDLHNLWHLLDLRTDSHAQYEIRQYANAVVDLLISAIPGLMTIWSDRQG